MARERPILRHIRRLLGGKDAGDGTDAQLLERYVATRDEADFEGLMQGHGPEMKTPGKQSVFRLRSTQRNSGF